VHGYQLRADNLFAADAVAASAVGRSAASG
jgi:hypothetical protein